MAAQQEGIEYIGMRNEQAACYAAQVPSKIIIIIIIIIKITIIIIIIIIIISYYLNSISITSTFPYATQNNMTKTPGKNGKTRSEDEMS